MHDKTPEHIPNEACNAIVCAAEGRGQEIPDYIVKYLCKSGYLRQSGSEIVPNIWIQRRSEKEKVHPIRKTPEWKKLSEKMAAYVRLCEETVGAEVSPFLREDKHTISQAVQMLIMNYVRDAVFKEALRSGYATFDASHWQGIGAYMII